MKLVITGGHHTSALPLISRIREEHSDYILYWIGHKHTLLSEKNDSLEYQEITSLGIPFYELIAGKIYKTYNLVRLLKVPIGFIHALYLLLKIKPDIVISFGGYLAAPVVLAAYLLRVKIITHEQTVVAGYANRLIGLFADKILISWGKSAKYFSKNKTVLTGIPIRPEIFKPTSHLFNTENDLPTLYVMGGKTGSHTVNRVIFDNLPKLLKICNIIHQCGSKSIYDDYSELTSLYESIKGTVSGKYFLKSFIMGSEIGEVYNRASLFVGRSGAHTVAEIICLNKPALFIPIPWVSHNEQFENANLVASYGLCEIVTEDLISEKFLSTLTTMLNSLDKYTVNDPAILANLSEDATGKMLNEINHLLSKNVQANKN